MRSFLVAILALYAPLQITATVDGSSSKLKADVGNWTVGDCIRIEFAMDFVLHPNDTNPNLIYTVTVPVSAKIDPTESNCGNDTQKMTLTWSDYCPQNNTQLSRTMSVIFKKNNINGTLYYGIDDVRAKFEYQRWNETVKTPQNKTMNV